MLILCITLWNMPWISSQLMRKTSSWRCTVTFQSQPKGERLWRSSVSFVTSSSRKFYIMWWCSLNPAISHLLENWTALKSYFITIGKECPKRLQDLLGLPTEATGVEEKPDVAEVYLLFCNNVLSLFEEVVKMLEPDATTSADLYAIMDSFLRRLNQRRDDKFYGYHQTKT